MATQQLSEVSELPLPKGATAAHAFRPHLVRLETSSAEADFTESERILGAWDSAAALHAPPLEIGEPDSALTARRPRVVPSPVHGSIRESVKRGFDIVAAIGLGLVFMPLMLVITLLLRNEGGPVIYRHRRIGRNGKSFECLKFRTMIPDADRKLRELLEERADLKAEWLRDHKLRHDPRITAVGRFLRRTSFDELPQIWNVLRGEMSLVGPRPIVREEMMRYGRCLPFYLSAKPGITGLWQVTGRNDTDYRRRVAIDVYYVRKRSALLDLYILLKTTRVILSGGGAY